MSGHAPRCWALAVSCMAVKGAHPCGLATLVYASDPDSAHSSRTSSSANRCTRDRAQSAVSAASDAVSGKPANRPADQSALDR